jgi:hypothetical protein
VATADSTEHTGVTLKPEEIAWYAAQAGFTGQALVNIVAIALAESGGRIGALGDGGESHGLWQVYAPAHRQYDANRLSTDPAYAAKAAFEISGGGKNFDPWTTWSHRTRAGEANAAQKYLDTASKATGIALAPGYQPETVSAGPASGTTLTAAATTVDDRLPPNSTPDQIEAWVTTHYPDLAPYLGNEEIRSILFYSAAADLAPEQVAAHIRNTDYWREHGPASRDFDALIARDPSEAGRAVERVKSTLKNLLSQQGVTLDDARLGDIAKGAIRDGSMNTAGQIVDPNLVNTKVAYVLRSKTGAGPLPAGEASATADKLGGIARSYLVPIDRKTLEDWSLKILSGQASAEQFQAYVTNLAKGQFTDPDVQAAIDSGVAPAQYFAPHRSIIADTLELDPYSVDLMDPKYRDVMQTVDPKTGKRRPMTLGEVTQWARNRPEFARTRAYKQNESEVGSNLLKFFDAVA